MRILMIAPEPFFEPRGTPFSEFHRIRALTDLGHHVDLVTYPFRQNLPMPGRRLRKPSRGAPALALVRRLRSRYTQGRSSSTKASTCCSRRRRSWQRGVRTPAYSWLEAAPRMWRVPGSGLGPLEWTVSRFLP